MRDTPARTPEGDGSDSWGALARDARSHLLRSALPVLLPVAVMWVFWLIGLGAGDWFQRSLALRPRTLDGLSGILATPLLHGSFGHLMSSTMSWLVLGTLVVLLVRRPWLVLTGIWLLSGALLWLAGRPARTWICNHPDGYDACVTPLQVGASGVIYGVAAFVVAYGVITRRIGAIIGAVVVLFFQGISLVLGMLPGTSGPGVSWEGHLVGAIAGVVVALLMTRTTRAARAARA